jgi:NAD(P)-dependent dehydrogenase (short-subunit alcohol dehydrogenase family)
MRDLDGKAAFVTGGASGLSLALARTFGRANMKVMLADIETVALNAAVSQLRRRREITASVRRPVFARSYGIIPFGMECVFLDV